MNDIRFLAALNRIPHLGTVRFRRLEAFFGDLGTAWNAPVDHLRAAGLEERPALEIVAARNSFSPDDEMDRLARAGVSVADWRSDIYPPRLKQIADPPPVIYYKGTLQPSDERAVAIVGTRKPTTYGLEATAFLSRDLAVNGITIVSGLALGIDGAAHRAALESGGRTLAVLAGELDSVYPKEHIELFQRIQTQGAVISEQPLGIKPGPRSFPRRNRLISGMTLGTVVVEAAEGSGARWTVYQAFEQNREVFCVPGSIFSPVSSFTHRMIQEGAKLATNCSDILRRVEYFQHRRPGSSRRRAPGRTPNGVGARGGRLRYRQRGDGFASTHRGGPGPHRRGGSPVRTPHYRRQWDADVARIERRDKVGWLHALR